MAVFILETSFIVHQIRTRKAFDKSERQLLVDQIVSFLYLKIAEIPS